MTEASDLPAFFRRIAQFPGEFVIYDDGYRGWTYTYADLARMAGALETRLRTEGIRKGDKVVVWSESRPGWIAALWACIMEGVIVVPIDPQASIALFRRLEERVHPRLLLLGNRVPPIEAENATPIWRMTDIEQDRREPPAETVALARDDIAEIVFTSGTTAEPKGVMITHRNLAANLQPIENQLIPYRKYISYLKPVRILNLLPMSHLFGQAFGLFVPPLIPASVVFISSGSAAEVARQIRERRVVAVAAVPKVLEVLRDFVGHRFPKMVQESDIRGSWWRRWWRYRALHRMFGWKFCCFLVGGAPLPSDLEQFWSRLVFLVVQGYGLTETAPIISFTHPFHVRLGTAGKPVEGVDVKIAEDGEVLVRGDNVTVGYYQAPEQTAAAFEDGWFRTGDVGEFDAEGNLIIRGRKKEMIVTPEGLNIFPEDVETVLNQIPGVKESAVIGKDRVHAVLVLEPGASADTIVRQANEQLEDHQKIRAVSVWPDSELPRTRTTRKLQHARIAEQLRTGQAEVPAQPEENELVKLLQKYAPGRTITPETTLDELGLSSMDRVELMMDLEQKMETTIDETAFASVRKVGELAHARPKREETRFPTYNRTRPIKSLRRLLLAGVFLPVSKLFAHAKISGLEHLTSLQGPVVFAANHRSHFDTPVILGSLPATWRRRIAVAMWKEYFEAHFAPAGYSLWMRGLMSTVYGVVTVVFNAFPVPQTEMDVRESIRYMGELVEEGWSILIFPEGERRPAGEVGRFQPGLGMIASHLRLPVVPIRVEGTERILPPDSGWPRMGRVEVRFGKPIVPQGESYSELAQKVREAIIAL
jgi:long-chain acyl-CoA synthetase